MINVGQIKKFKLFDSIIYCVVEKFNKKEIVIGDLEYIKHEINRYYVIVEESGINEVVTIDKIIRKCVKIDTSDIIQSILLGAKFNYLSYFEQSIKVKIIEEWFTKSNIGANYGITVESLTEIVASPVARHGALVPTHH